MRATEAGNKKPAGAGFALWPDARYPPKDRMARIISSAGAYAYDMPRILPRIPIDMLLITQAPQAIASKTSRFAK